MSIADAEVSHCGLVFVSRLVLIPHPTPLPLSILSQHLALTSEPIFWYSSVERVRGSRSVCVRAPYSRNVLMAVLRRRLIPARDSLIRLPTFWKVCTLRPELAREGWFRPKGDDDRPGRPAACELGSTGTPERHSLARRALKGPVECRVAQASATPPLPLGRHAGCARSPRLRTCGMSKGPSLEGFDPRLVVTVRFSASPWACAQGESWPGTTSFGEFTVCVTARVSPSSSCWS